MAAKTHKLISVTIPVYNEQDNVQRAYDEIKAVFDGLPDYDFELVFTDNHSTDKTFGLLCEMAKADPRVKVARFARNFGFNKSLLTGFQLAKGDAAIQIDCDLQDPPSLFPEMIAKWEAGHDVVVGIRQKRKEGKMLRCGRHAFYWLLNQISEDELLVGGGEFRLLDRSILDQLRTIYDSNPYVRGMTSSLAKNQIGIPFERNARLYGESKFPLPKLIGLAIVGIINHSTKPLRLASLAGFCAAFITMVMALGYLIGSLIFGVSWPEGFATTTVLILFGISLNAIFLGIIGEYLAKIYQQLHQRPLTIIRESVNLDHD